MNRRYYYVATGLLLLSANSFAGADSVTVDITANIKETTCQISVESNHMASSSGDNYSLAFYTNDENSEPHLVFTLKAANCSSGLSDIRTTFNGTPSAMGGEYFKNTYNCHNAVYQCVSRALTLSRESVPDALFSVNSLIDAERLVWSAAEINQGAVDLRATLVQATGDSYIAPGGTVGSFSTDVTLQFDYQ